MDFQKTLRKSTLFFLSNPVSFNGQNYQKQKGPGTSDQLLLRLQKQAQKNSFVSFLFYLNSFIPLLKISFLFDQV